MQSLINPALSELKFLVGDWSMELSNAAFLPNPTEKIEGHASFEVIENGAFLVMHQSGAASWVVGHDEGQEEYEVLYFDERKVSRIYKMSFDSSVWKMWRDSPGFYQRFEGKVGQDKKTIKAYWEKSTDGGKNWQHDFDMFFIKI